MQIWERITLEIQTNDDVTLRDIRQEDIADYTRWETVETEWQLWDAPWLYEGRTPKQCERELKEYIEKLGHWVSEASEYSDSSIRSRFEIDYQGEHVGSCASYLIDSDCNILAGAIQHPSAERLASACLIPSTAGTALPPRHSRVLSIT